MPSSPTLSIATTLPSYETISFYAEYNESSNTSITSLSLPSAGSRSPGETSYFQHSPERPLPELPQPLLIQSPYTSRRHNANTPNESNISLPVSPNTPKVPQPLIGGGSVRIPLSQKTRDRFDSMIKPRWRDGPYQYFGVSESPIPEKMFDFFSSY